MTLPNTARHWFWYEEMRQVLVLHRLQDAHYHARLLAQPATQQCKSDPPILLGAGLVQFVLGVVKSEREA